MATGETTTSPDRQAGKVRAWQLVLYPLGIVTALLITGFIGWLIYAVGSVWMGRLR